ncbi:MAG: DUF4105 domain-containing protein [Polyangiaceae bacterium]|nr:DUF4105 domain-containing protein [Polyangiaceae bacterium]
MPIPTTLIAAIAALHVDVYTMEQGEHVFERFGHAAICVVTGERPNTTRCYNYGTTDFGSPPAELGWRFLRGSANFWVSVWLEAAMIAAYSRADRTVWRQRLALTPAEARAVRAALEHDARPEHRNYVYHHFLDNCSTRIRDVLDRGTAGRLSSHGSRPFPSTYRQLGRRGLAEFTSVLALSDFLLGRLADRPLDVRSAMFLPSVLRAEITERFGAEPVLVYRRRGAPFVETGPSGRGMLVAVSVLLAILAAVATRIRRGAWAALLLPALGLGVTGCGLWLVAVVSVVPELRQNEALLAFWPTDLCLPWLGASWLRRYSRLRLGVTVLLGLLLAAGVCRQPLVVPLLLPLGVFFAIAWGGRRFRDQALPDGSQAGVERNESSRDRQGEGVLRS